MTANAIDCLLFGLLILAAIVQAGAMLVMLRAALGQEAFAQKIVSESVGDPLAATVAGAILYVVLGMRIGIIDLSGRPRGTLAADETEKPPTA